jgi:hypothetical protein
VYIFYLSILSYHLILSLNWSYINWFHLTYLSIYLPTLWIL